MANSKRDTVHQAPPARSEQTSQGKRRAHAPVRSPLEQKHQRAADRRCERRDAGVRFFISKRIWALWAKTTSKLRPKSGAAIAERAKKAGVEAAYFDRGGFLFHGKVKALADAAREGGLKI